MNGRLIKKVSLFMLLFIMGCADLNKNPYEVMTKDEIKFSKQLIKFVNIEYNENKMVELFGSIQEKINIKKHGFTDFCDPFKPDKGQIRFYVHNKIITRISWIRIDEDSFIWSPEQHEKFKDKIPEN